MDYITPELLSSYADGQLSSKDRKAVERALEDDPALAAELEDLQDLEALFGHIEPEPVSGALKEKLYALDPVPALAGFEAHTPEIGRTEPTNGWRHWAMAAAALLLVAVGAFKLFDRAEVVLQSFARMDVDRDSGSLVDFRDVAQVTFKEGDRIETEDAERVSFRFGDGSEVVLLPGSVLRLKSGEDGRLFDLEEGTVLCTLIMQGLDRSIEAGGYPITGDDAVFGIRVEGPKLRTAGPGLGSPARVTVAVGRGSLTVAKNGDTEHVAAGWKVVLERGRAPERSAAHSDAIYPVLHRFFPRLGKTIMPGYYSNETDVRRIPRRSWIREDHALVLAVSDKRTGRYLVLHMRGTEPTPLRLTRVWPKPAAPGKAKVEAETSTVTLPGVGTEWSVVVVPITAFNEEGAERGKRMVPANRSRLVRLELGATEKGAGVELRSALWADHRPTASSEEVR